ncbi:hypothetical protein BH20ACT24_BH20ACT24_13910 [soil metagenome]
MKKTFVALVTGGVLLFAAPAAFAEEVTCRGTMGAVTVDNVRVPEGATCSMNARGP